MVVREEFQKFCRSTTMKGVPRMCSSDLVGLRVVWFLAVGSLFSIGVFQVWLLIASYLSYPVFSSEQERFIELGADLSAGSAVIPFITVCSKSAVPLWNLQNIPDELSIDSYFERVTNITTCDSCDAKTAEELEDLRGELMSPQGYFQFIGHENAGKFGQNQQTFIRDCSLQVYRGMGIVMVPCRDEVTITRHLTANYFNCFELKIKRVTSPGRLVFGIGLTLFLGDYDPEGTQSSHHFNPLSLSGFSSGARIIFHNAQSVGEMKGREDEGYLAFIRTVEVSPGFSSAVEMRREDRQRLPPPHGECDPSVPTMMNNQMYCANECAGKRATAQCHCTKAQNAHPVQEANGSFPYCTDVRLGREKIINNARCLQLNGMKSFFECSHQCPYGCYEWSFTPSVSVSRWPTPNSLPGFYKTYVRPLLNETGARLAWMEQALLNPANATASERHLAEQFVERNFLQFRVILGGHSYSLLKDEIDIHSVDLLSSIGGTLNLWTGITVIFLVELFELLYRVVYRKVCCRRGGVDCMTDARENPHTNNSNNHIRVSLDDTKTAHR